MSLCLTFGTYPKVAAHGHRESALITHDVIDRSHLQDMGDWRQLAHKRRGMPIYAFVGARLSESRPLSQTDIMEGVNNAGVNAATLHTAPNCSVSQQDTTGYEDSLFQVSTLLTLFKHTATSKLRR
jgi:hypothetical protein